MSRRAGIAVFLSSLLLLLAPFLGSEWLSPAEILTPGSVAHRIFFDLRLPRLLLVTLTGGSLALLGGTYQILFHNPLAEHYILGISSAVLLGNALAEIFLHFAPYSYAAGASGLVVAMLIIGLLVMLYVSRWGNGIRGAMDSLVLFGTGLNFMLSSLVFLLISYQSQQLGGGSWRWLFGQIPWISMSDATHLVFFATPFLAILLLLSRHLDALSLGDSVARSLGFQPQQTRIFLLVLTSAFLSLLVSYTGAIGFVGLVIPHAARRLGRPATTRRLFLLAFGFGAVFLAISDVLSRSLLPPYEFPIGIITTLLGGPAFLILLWRQRGS